MDPMLISSLNSTIMASNPEGIEPKKSVNVGQTKEKKVHASGEAFS